MLPPSDETVYSETDHSTADRAADRNPVLVVEHQPGEGPGTLGELLERRGHPRRRVAVYRGDQVPDSPRGCAGVVLMGGPMSVNDPLPWLERERRLVRSALHDGIPVLGICLGGQLVASALGAEVGPSAVREIGWHPVERVPGPAADEWLGDLPDRFVVFHWHGEAFELPHGARPILRSPACWQGFAVGRALALQCHPEMTSAMVREWAAGPGARLEPSASVQTADEMTAGLEERIGALRTVAERLLGGWVDRLSA